MGLLDQTIERILSVKTDVQLKALAILIFAVIAIMMCMPIASGKATEFSLQQLGVIFLCVSGVIIVILSDRIVSLKFSKDKLNIKLAEIKDSVNETITEVEHLSTRTTPPPPVSAAAVPESTASAKKDSEDAGDRLKQARQLVSQPVSSDRMEDMLKDAENIGLAMRMLRKVISTYEQTQPESGENDQ